MSKILLVKNLSGSFNDQNIGHEVINNFCDDNGNAYFYIPPYGCLSSEKKDFYQSEAYKSIDIILVVDDINITNIYKLKQVIFNPIKFKSFNDMKDEAHLVKYSNKLLENIDFGDQSFIENNNKDFITDLVDESMKVYLLSYKLDKNKVYDFENDNIFIYVKSSEKRNNLKAKSLETFKMIYGEDAKISELDIVLGQKQYAYKNLSNLNSWFDNKVKPMCNETHLMNYQKVPTDFVSSYLYDDNNFLAFVRKGNDENYYTNYINGILNSNTELLSKFFNYLVEKIYRKENYISINPKCLIQKQSMTTDMKIINKLIRYRLEHSEHDVRIENEKEIKKLKQRFSYTDDVISSYISDSLSNAELNRLYFIDGQMDLYLYDDNYRIVIENKILSGLNGKHDEISEEINQLKTYNRYLNHLNNYKRKENKVIILCPYSLHTNFVNYKIDEDFVPTITYRDLADFFNRNSSMILEVYRDDFIKTINKQALTKWELITYRFIKTISL